MTTTTTTALRTGPSLAQMRKMTREQLRRQIDAEWADCGGLKGLKSRGRA